MATPMLILASYIIIIAIIMFISALSCRLKTVDPLPVLPRLLVMRGGMQSCHPIQLQYYAIDGTEIQKKYKRNTMEINLIEMLSPLRILLQGNAMKNRTTILCCLNCTCSASQLFQGIFVQIYFQEQMRPRRGDGAVGLCWKKLSPS